MLLNCQAARITRDVRALQGHPRSARRRDCGITRPNIGEFVTSLDMAGCPCRCCGWTTTCAHMTPPPTRPLTAAVGGFVTDRADLTRSCSHAILAAIENAEDDLAHLDAAAGDATRRRMVRGFRARSRRAGVRQRRARRDRRRCQECLHGCGGRPGRSDAPRHRWQEAAGCPGRKRRLPRHAGGLDTARSRQAKTPRHVMVDTLARLSPRWRRARARAAAGGRVARCSRRPRRYGGHR